MRFFFIFFDINDLEIVDGDFTRIGAVEFFECAHDQVPPALSHRRPQSDEKLVKGNASRFSGIKSIKHIFDLVGLHVNSEIVHTFTEFLEKYRSEFIKKTQRS